MQGITSGMAPMLQRNEEEVLKQMLKDRGLSEIEERLGIRIPRDKEESEEALINRALGMTGRPISKRGNEFIYGDDDGLSFYINPETNGGGLRYSKKFADGGISNLKDGGFPDLTGDGKVTQKDILRGRGIEGFADGGEAGTKYFGRDGLIFDPYNPLDYAMAIPGLGLAGAGIKALSTGNKMKKAANAASKLSNPVTNTAAGGALAYTIGDAIKEGLSEDYTNPSVAYIDEDSGNYFYYDPVDEDYYLFEDNEVPEGYTLEQ